MIVVDTNVVAYLWMPGHLTAAAESLLKDDAEWAVPLLWRSEFRSILVGAVRHKTVSVSRAAAIADAAEAHLRDREFSVESADVLALAIPSGCSAYDCEYVALANDLRVRLVTNDSQVLRAFPTVAVPLAQFAPDA